MTMHTEAKIKELLDRYLKGETTLEEEHVLSNYFKNTAAKPEWKAYKQMFLCFDDNRQLQSEKSFQPQTKTSLKIFYKYAAVLLIAIAGAWFYNFQYNTNNLGTYDDPEVALEETKKVFDLISYHLNSGQKDMKYLETLNETKTKYIDNITP